MAGAGVEILIIDERAHRRHRHQDQDGIRELIAEITRGGVSVLLISSDMPETITLADRILVMKDFACSPARSTIRAAVRADEPRHHGALSMPAASASRAAQALSSRLRALMADEAAGTRPWTAPMPSCRFTRSSTACCASISPSGNCRPASSSARRRSPAPGSEPRTRRRPRSAACEAEGLLRPSTAAGLASPAPACRSALISSRPTASPGARGLDSAALRTRRARHLSRGRAHRRLDHRLWPLPAEREPARRALWRQAARWRTRSSPAWSAPASCCRIATSAGMPAADGRS